MVSQDRFHCSATRSFLKVALLAAHRKPLVTMVALLTVGLSESLTSQAKLITAGEQHMSTSKSFKGQISPSPVFHEI